MNYFVWVCHGVGLNEWRKVLFLYLKYKDMKNLTLTLYYLLAIGALLSLFRAGSAQENRSIDASYPIGVQKLMAAYPSHVKDYKEGYLIFHDRTQMLYDDGQNKSYLMLLEDSDIQDMFAYPYPKERQTSPPEDKHDPGRIRNEAFFKKIYGQSEDEVKQHLTEIAWCPQTVGQTLRVTTINGVDKQLLKISEQLDNHPEWADFIRAMGSGFNWRVIAGTDRLSAHSFGIAIDLSRAYSDYWLRDYNTADESVPITYKNRFLLEIVEIFEQHGFIWGGKWYHYDTMHFEYRPELLVEL